MINRPQQWTAPMLDKLRTMLDESAVALLDGHPCPTWCAEAAEHSWETSTDGFFRTHSADFGIVSVCQDEALDATGSRFDTPECRWFGPEPGQRLHPGDAVALADDIAAAFHLIGTVT